MVIVATPKSGSAETLIPQDGVPVEAAIAGLFTRYVTTVPGPPCLTPAGALSAPQNWYACPGVRHVPVPMHFLRGFVRRPLRPGRGVGPLASPS